MGNWVVFNNHHPREKENVCELPQHCRNCRPTRTAARTSRGNPGAGCAAMCAACNVRASSAAFWVQYACRTATNRAEQLVSWPTARFCRLDRSSTICSGSHYVCSVCHGTGALDGMEEFLTNDAGPAEIQIKAAAPRRPGRPPRPIPVQKTTALQAALEQIA